MPRPKKEVDPVRIERLKTVLYEQGLTQTELAGRIPISQQVMSRMLNGAATITEKTIKAIVREFPEYRFEWLMGFDNHKTTKDYEDFYNAKQAHIEVALDTLLEFLLNSRDYELKHSTYLHDSICERTVYVLKGGRLLGEMDIKDWQQLYKQVADYAEFIVIQALKGGNETNGS